MNRQLELVDTLLLEGRGEFTFEDARGHLKVSSEATANFLARLARKGLVNKLARGHYAIRPLGALGTSLTTQDLGVAVGATFEGREHRIAYLSALSELGVLSHPVRTVFVACTEQVRFSSVSRRPLRVVVEKSETIHMEAEALQNSWRSSLERALFECALRVDLIGGVERLADAIAAGSRDANPLRIARLAKDFGARGHAAERRLASIATALHLPLTLTPEVDKRQHVIRLDPRDDRVTWTDTRFRVAWNTTVDELHAVVGELAMLTRFAITRRADDDGVDALVVERDYVLAHIVAQLHRAKPTDGGQLVFKGGTALRLVHISDYRYSADLDFTIVGASASAATTSMVEVLEAARDFAGLPVLELTDVGNRIAYVGPLEAHKPRLLKLDISDTEVLTTVEQRTMLDGVWSDLPEAVPFAVYSVDEIAAEKLRCVIQRVECRDLYDIFRLVDEIGVSLSEVRLKFEQKATAKGLDPAAFADKFADRINRYKGRWSREMSDHLAEPPQFDDVVRVVRRHLRTAGLLSS